MAATYGWSARRVEHELTDELLVLYLDEATDRLAAAFDAQVEAVRAGTIFGSSQDGNKQHAKWVRSRRIRKSGITGTALEQALMSIAKLHPDIVTVRA